MNDAISIVSGILLMILILLMAYGSSRLLGKHWRMLGRARYMELVDRLPLGQDRELLILRLEKEDRLLLLGSGADGICLLSELSGEYLRENRGLSAERLPQSFRELLRRRSIGAGREGQVDRDE
ncbi:MAG: flagellar biosynthetic protein FliO [Oribacterium sp.]